MAQQAGAPLKLFVARKIITMDPGWPTATAVAVRDGRIVSVGSLADLQPWLDRYPHDVAQTFADKVLLPGFIDPHQHPLVGGAALCLPTVAYYDTANPYGPPARGLKTKAEVIGRLRELAGQSQASDEPLLAWGYDAIALGGPLTKDDLDAVSTTRQVIVWDASEHDMFANSAALRARNVTRESTRLAGVCTGPDGEPNGHFAGKPASLTYFADVFQSTLQPDRIAKIMQYIVDLNRQGGVTTMADLALGIAAGVDVEAALFARFFNDPRTPVRCLAVVDAGAMTRQHGDQAVAAALALRSQNTDKFCFNGVKFFSDDAFVSLGMQVAAPGYTDGHGGLWITDASAATEEQMRPWWKAGFDIHVHTNGDASQSALLDTLAALQRDYPRFDHRFTFEHYGLSTPAQARRLKALGAAVSANGYYLWLRGEINAAYLGTDRSYLASRLRTLSTRACRRRCTQTRPSRRRARCSRPGSPSIATASRGACWRPPSA